MPFTRKFQNGMGFPKVGQVIKGFTVESISVSHVNIRGGFYEYPTEIVVKGAGDANRVKKTFKEFYSDRRTLFSGYGNPYQCVHGKIDVQSLGNDRFLIISSGSCIRIHLAPELEGFMEYLHNNGNLAKDLAKDEWKEIVAEYMMEYEKSASRVKPFFH